MSGYIHPDGKHPKPILLRPTTELRKKLEAEAHSQCRSLHNVVLIILLRHFSLAPLSELDRRLKD